MTRDELWEHLTTRNPGLLAGKALTPRGLRQFFDAVWDEAQARIAEETREDMPDFLAGLFGHRRG